MFRPLHTTAAITACLLLAGCTGGSGTGSGARVADAVPDRRTAGPACRRRRWSRGLDVCSLASPAEVRRAGGQEGDPSSRTLTSLPGYRGVADECGFGVSFDSASLRVAVGLAPATRADVRRAGGRPVTGPWAVARSRVDPDSEQVTFLRGTTLVRLRVPRVTDAPSRLAPLTKAARDAGHPGAVRAAGERRADHRALHRGRPGPGGRGARGAGRGVAEPGLPERVGRPARGPPAPPGPGP